MAKDFYTTLGVSRSASETDIKQAYRKLSKELHPDKHKGDKGRETKFKEVNEAYEVLSNPKKRQMYDQFGASGASGVGGGASGFGNAGGFNGFDFSSFTGGNGSFGDLFESFFGGAARGGHERHAEERGNDREIEVTIDFMEAVRGADRAFSVRMLAVCAECGGSGALKGSALTSCKECGGTGQVTRASQSLFGVIQQRFLCPRCHGAGRVPEHPCRTCDGEGRVTGPRQVTVKIPAGIGDGQTLRVQGGGDAGRRKAPAGDLYVHIRVRPDPRFERDGDDIRSRLSLPLLDAILGADKDVETVHGAITLKIPEGTQSGQIFRLKGKGMPVLSTSRYGDHYVTVEVKIPRRLSREERRLMEEWRRVSSE